MILPEHDIAIGVPVKHVVVQDIRFAFFGKFIRVDKHLDDALFLVVLPVIENAFEVTVRNIGAYREFASSHRRLVRSRGQSGIGRDIILSIRHGEGEKSCCKSLENQFHSIQPCGFQVLATFLANPHLPEIRIFTTM